MNAIQPTAFRYQSERMSDRKQTLEEAGLPASRDDGMCACEGCEKPKDRTHPLCHGHAKRYQRQGVIGGPLRKRSKSGVSYPITTICAAAGCDRKAVAKGYCRRCRLREQRGWTLTESESVPPPRRKTHKPKYEGVECAIRECRKQAKAVGFCSGHYQAVRSGMIVEDGRIVPRKRGRNRKQTVEAGECIIVGCTQQASTHQAKLSEYCYHHDLAIRGGRIMEDGRIVEGIKKCRQCRETKPLVEFYFYSKGRGRNKGHNSQCKACDNTRIAKRLAERQGHEYTPRPDDYGKYSRCTLCGKPYRGSRRPPICTKCEKPRKRVSKFGEWGQAVADARGKTRRRVRKYGEWTERIGSAQVSLRIRDRDKVARKVGRSPDTWKAAIAQARKFTQDDRYGIWTRKIRNTTHNWAIKARAEAERKGTI